MAALLASLYQLNVSPQSAESWAAFVARFQLTEGRDPAVRDRTALRLAALRNVAIAAGVAAALYGVPVTSFGASAMGFDFWVGSSNARVLRRAAELRVRAMGLAGGGLLAQAVAPTFSGQRASTRATIASAVVQALGHAGAVAVGAVRVGDPVAFAVGTAAQVAASYIGTRATEGAWSDDAELKFEEMKGSLKPGRWDAAASVVLNAAQRQGAATALASKALSEAARVRDLRGLQWESNLKGSVLKWKASLEALQAKRAALEAWIVEARAVEQMSLSQRLLIEEAERSSLGLERQAARMRIAVNEFLSAACAVNPDAEVAVYHGAPNAAGGVREHPLIEPFRPQTPMESTWLFSSARKRPRANAAGAGGAAGGAPQTIWNRAFDAASKRVRRLATSAVGAAVATAAGAAVSAVAGPGAGAAAAAAAAGAFAPAAAAPAPAAPAPVAAAPAVLQYVNDPVAAAAVIQTEHFIGVGYHIGRRMLYVRFMRNKFAIMKRYDEFNPRHGYVVPTKEALVHSHLPKYINDGNGWPDYRVHTAQAVFVHLYEQGEAEIAAEVAAAAAAQPASAAPP